MLYSIVKSNKPELKTEIIIIRTDKQVAFVMILFNDLLIEVSCWVWFFIILFNMQSIYYEKLHDKEREYEYFYGTIF